ncbi:hypothetical protein CDL12_27941 [Handroanthus impetiginosus]|uniref:DUF4378 domain-containing protein n=1 Tax=Handroanthus impetiginosus TaxID=429701 RepID=A0A2G9G2P7_9LAMI|nr:hypothetical protein CDL12_27941 [Handroanthus impetiginosus]
MAMRFQKHPSRYEGNQAGCISGLISIFDFRHGRSTRRLLADKRPAGKEVVGVRNSSIQTVSEVHEKVVDALEHKMLMADVAKTSVKELMEKEMLNEQSSENQTNCSEIDYDRTDSKHEKIRTLHNSSRNMDVSELDAAKCSMPENFYNFSGIDDLHLEIIMQELAKINQETNAGLDIRPGQTLTVLEEKLSAAVDMFIDQRLINSKHFGEGGETCWSKEFMDAQQTISSNKDLFLKLLQDRNMLLVKHVQSLEEAPLGKDRTCCSSPSYRSEEIPKDSRPDKLSSHRHHNFFHRRTKSLSSFRFRGEKDCQSSNKIDVLEPRSAGTQSPQADLDISNILMHSRCKTSNKVRYERNASQFSFTGIKQKLRHAIGKWKQGISPNRNHFHTERFAKSSTSFQKGEHEQVGKSKDSDLTMVNQTCQYAKLEVSNIYIEARKHLSEMLNNGDENVDATTRPMSVSLGRILSLPDHIGSSCCSPRKYSDGSFAAALMMKNDVNGFLEENFSGPVNEVQCVNVNVSIPLEGDNECSSEIQSVTQDTITPEVSSSSSEVVEIQETTGLRPQEEENTTDVHSISTSSYTGDIKSEDIKQVVNEESTFPGLKDSSPCFDSDLFGEVQMMSSPPVSREVGDSECANDRTERPSPVSVLEPLFTYDDISPASTISHPVAKEIQPQDIQFEERYPAGNHGVCMTISLNDEESAFEYVEAVLLGSGLNWDEFLFRWISLDEILDESLFHEVELFSGRPPYDQKLLFDCANEVLKEVCERYFGSFGNQSIQPVLNGIDLINEVWAQVEHRLFQHPMLDSLDQLVKIDMIRCGEWINLHSGIELISFEMGETIFDELVQDTLRSFVENTSEYQLIPSS